MLTLKVIRKKESIKNISCVISCVVVVSWKRLIDSRVSSSRYFLNIFNPAILCDLLALKLIKFNSGVFVGLCSLSGGRPRHLSLKLLQLHGGWLVEVLRTRHWESWGRAVNSVKTGGIVMSDCHILWLLALRDVSAETWNNEETVGVLHWGVGVKPWVVSGRCDRTTCLDSYREWRSISVL